MMNDNVNVDDGDDDDPKILVNDYEDEDEEPPQQQQQQQDQQQAPNGGANGNNNNDDDFMVEIITQAYNDKPRFQRQYNGEEGPFRVIIVPSDDDNNTVLSDCAFECCSNLTEAVIRDGITTIGNQAFYDCPNLKRIKLPEGIIDLGRYAFVGCNSLRGRIVIPRSVQYIGWYCFARCVSLQIVVFHPTANVALYDGIFEGCENFRSVTLPQNLPSIPNYFLVNCSSMEEIQLPESVCEIGRYAFHRSGLRSIELSMNIRTIGFGAFEGCASLERVTIRSSSSSNLRIGDDTFKGCSSLNTIKAYPWMWPKIFASMKNDTEFIMKFYRQNHNHICLI